MGGTEPHVPRIRQAVLAARELEPVATRLRDGLGLAEPFSDPAVEYFGLRNAVFALGDTFLEVVSPVREDTAAGRLLDRRGAECGYMIMFQVPDLSAARERANAHGIREVFQVENEAMAEVHLHPADMRGAIVSLSDPRPPESWCWGGPGWERRSAELRVVGARIAVSDAGAVSQRWSAVLGAAAPSIGVQFTASESAAGLVEVVLAGAPAPRDPIELGGLRFVFAR